MQMQRHNNHVRIHLHTRQTAFTRSADDSRNKTHLYILRTTREKRRKIFREHFPHYFRDGARTVTAAHEAGQRRPRGDSCSEQCAQGGRWPGAMRQVR
jgi:hypothetical protein